MRASHQPLIDMLWRFYIAANRPPTRKIADTIAAWADEQRTGSANHETVRRALRGDSVGAWQTTEMIFRALCEIADVDPDDIEAGDEDDRWDPPVRHIERVRRYWHQAVDEAPTPDLPRTRSERAAQEAAAKAAQVQQPWSADQPPF